MTVRVTGGGVSRVSRSVADKGVVSRAKVKPVSCKKRKA